jgi:hypothetical protein
MIRLLLAILKQLIKPLNRIAAALERIARAQEESLMGHSSTGLRSYYLGDDPGAGDVILQTDEDFALMEALERKKGDVPLDDDLGLDEPEIDLG